MQRTNTISVLGPGLTRVAVAVLLLTFSACSLQFEMSDLRHPVVLNRHPFVGCDEPPCDVEWVDLFEADSRVVTIGVGSPSGGVREQFRGAVDAEARKLIGGKADRAITDLSIEVISRSSFFVFGFGKSMRVVVDGQAVEYVQRQSR